MKKEELNRIIYISIAISSFLILIYLLINKSFEAIVFYRGASFSISIVTLFWAFYFKFGWKIWGFRKMFYRPNLNGTWRGCFESDWKDNNGKISDPKEIFIVIRQNFLRIHFTTFTNSFIGYSYSETFNLKKDTGLKNITYLYRKDTSRNNDDDLREGATELRFVFDKKYKKLDGKFWTNTKTNGKINVTFLSKDYIDSFESGKSL